MRATGRIAGSLLALGLALTALVSPPATDANPSICSNDPPPVPSPRIVHDSLDGLDFNVLLPSDYGTSERRYAVLYLLHGAFYNENTWLGQTDLEQFTAPFSGDQAAIVVMPDGGPLGFYRDWAVGNQQWESYHIDRLISHIDAQFRTRADRSHRAVAGFSLGGLGAMQYAARHPDLFVAAGAFSGLTDMTFPEPAYTGASAANPLPGAGSAGPASNGRATPAYQAPDDQGSGCGQSQGSAFGDRIGDAIDWHNHNPTDLASNLRGLAVYLASGNGLPCGPQDVLGPPSFAGPAFEPAVLQMNQSFDQALTQASVSHTTDIYGCGIHTQAYAQRDLHQFWPRMVAGFGSKAPQDFDYRTADPDFDVWGWTFLADPQRAAEFLEVHETSTRKRRLGHRRGRRRRRITTLTLTGSGTETAITPALFRPMQRVAVRGALPHRAHADASGRVRIRVDLGPAGSQAQFQPGAPAPNFVTRIVRLFGAPDGAHRARR